MVGAAVVCWIVAVREMHGMDMGPGSALGSFPFFVFVWLTMMAAMMLPSALPMVLVFDRVRRGRRAAGRVSPPTSVFVSAYLMVWGILGVVAFLLDRGVRDWASPFLAWNSHGPLVAGLAVVGAGVYELTPLKRVCLGHCRSPMDYVLGGWQPGWAGALRMGGGHGLYCVGCCWALMLVLFALGVMSVFWMSAVAAIIFLEKLLPRGERFPWLVAASLFGLGIWIIVAPESVPHLTRTHGM